MIDTRYAIASIADVVSTDGSDSGHADLTEPLGCTETRVDAYHCPGGESITLPPEPERLVIPMGGPGVITLNEPTSVPASGIGCVPAETPCDISNDAPATWLIISVDAPGGHGRSLAVVDWDRVPFNEPATSTILIARLTAALGCTGMKVNARRLRPGDRVPYHTEGRQEELFVPITGESPKMVIDGESFPVPVGSIARVAPQTPRAAVNEGPSDSMWIMIGAPPTGAADEWDPGAEILDWPDGL